MTQITEAEKARKQKMLDQLVADVRDKVLLEIRGHYVSLPEHQLVLKRLINIEMQLEILAAKLQMERKISDTPLPKIDKQHLKHHKFSARELVIDVLETYGGAKGLTVREIQNLAGLSGTNGIKEAIQRLKRTGLIGSETAWPEFNTNVCRYYLKEKRQ